MNSSAPKDSKRSSGGAHVTIRVLVLVAGLIVALGAYSYAMFHTLLPTASDLTDVADCGVRTFGDRARESASETPSVAGLDSPLCYSHARKWVQTPYGDAPIFLALVILLGSMVVASHRSQFLKWAARSPWGHQVLGQLAFGIPMTLLFLHLNYVEGTLTSDWAVHVVTIGIISGVVMGVLLWYTLTRPLIARIAARRNLRP